MTHHLLAIVTSDPIGPEAIRELRPNGAPDRASELRVVIPAVEANPLRHTLGDIDEPRREVEARLGRVLEELRGEASGPLARSVTPTRFRQLKMPC